LDVVTCATDIRSVRTILTVLSVSLASASAAEVRSRNAKIKKPSQRLKRIECGVCLSRVTVKQDNAMKYNERIDKR
jgi:hypothetical protein